jgi:hypothetical protein
VDLALDRARPWRSTVRRIAASGLGDSCELVGACCVSIEAHRLVLFSILRRRQPLATTEVALERRNVLVSDSERDGEHAAMRAAKKRFCALHTNASAPLREQNPHVGSEEAAKVSSLEAADLGRAGERQWVIDVRRNMVHQPLQAPIDGRHRTSARGDTKPAGVDTIALSDETRQKK